MLTTILSIISLTILAAEFWLGVAVIGFSGKDILIEKSKSPGPYWLMMTLHCIGAVGIPTIAYFAGL